MINEKTIIKSDRKIKAMENTTPTMNHYPGDRQMGDTDP